MHYPSNVRLTGPLMPYADGFREELARRGYAPGSAEYLVRLLAHLSRWLASHDLQAGELTQEVERRFFAMRRSLGYTHHLTERSLSPLREYLRRLDVVPATATPVAGTPLETLLKNYQGYLVRERGLCPGSVAVYERVARRFLSEQSSVAGFDLGALVAADVTRFVLGEYRRGCGPSLATTVVPALRSLLRYLHVEGLTPLQLAPGVPSVPGWRGRALPRALEDEQVARLLASCDRQRSTGRRDYAVLILLTRLGLRPGEVAALEIDDIDWRQGEMTIRGKGNRHERLPLPIDVGEALVDYLRWGRPRHECPRLFMRAQAPYDGLSRNAVTELVYAACERAGLPPLGAHRLRHTAATRMLRAGAQLSEVGQVLRHRSLTTTAIYAKVDAAALRPLALPWPEGVA